MYRYLTPIPCRFCGAVIARRSVKGVPWLSVAAVFWLFNINTPSMEAPVRKTAVAKVLARRLGIPISRINHIGDRLGDAGLVSKAEGSRRFPPELSTGEVAALVLGTITDRGLGRVADTVAEFSDLRDARGTRFGDALPAILGGPPGQSVVALGSLIVNLDDPSVRLTANGEHSVFGPDVRTAGRHSIVPGRVLSSIVLELQGHRPDEADAIVALSAVSRSLAPLSVGEAR